MCLVVLGYQGKLGALFCRVEVPDSHGQYEAGPLGMDGHKRKAGTNWGKCPTQYTIWGTAVTEDQRQRGCESIGHAYLDSSFGHAPVPVGELALTGSHQNDVIDLVFNAEGVL